MAMPSSFEYKNVYLRGRPIHQKYDAFWRKHPPMEPGRWAKIFAPFDALDGFDEAVSAKDILYCARKELSEIEKEELDQKLSVLHALTRNSREARKNAPEAVIRYFAPCTDQHSEWYGRGGKYLSINGIVRKIDAIKRTVTIGDSTVPLDDIIKIELSSTITL